MSSEPTRGPGGTVPEGSARPGSERLDEVSAGGVVVRDGEVLVIVPRRRAADRSLVLALPKGHIDEGETAIEAATREVREETGVTAEAVAELGETRYWYTHRGRRVRKAVHFYLFRYVQGDPADHDDEVLEARWMALEQAREALTYEGEREILERAGAARLARSVKDR
jgi:8-oxo-dGTP pyrophosphatase MutT (NUDIX family)